MSRLTTVTATSMMFIGSRSCARAIATAEGGFSAVIWFGPWVARRSAASCAESPDVTSVCRSWTTSAAGRRYGGVASTAAAAGFSLMLIESLSCCRACGRSPELQPGLVDGDPGARRAGEDRREVV